MPRFNQECSTCGDTFSHKQELRQHLWDNPSCKTIPKSPQHIPEKDFQKHPRGTFFASQNKSTLNKEKPSHPVAAGSCRNPTPLLPNSNHKFEDAALLGVMEKRMKQLPPRKSGLEASVLSSIAEGDSELVTAYNKLSSNPKSGAKILTPDIVETTVTKTKIDVDRLAGMIMKAQNVSICFLVDTTGSMTRYINGIKDQIVQMVNDIRASNCGIAGLSFVGYKDWSDGEDHFEILPFTTKVGYFKKFVADIKAGGGGDVPEDVLGGLNRALQLEWPKSSGSRILFHLADAPPHGGALYHRHKDDYPRGHPKDTSLADLFKRMREKNVVYFFGRINKECDLMLRVFETFYGDRIDTLDSTKVSTLSSHVTASVMKTVSASCSSTLSAVKTGSSAIRRYKLDKREPEWARLPSTVVTILSFKLPDSISTITSFAKMEDVLRRCQAQIAPNPFAKGSLRLVYYGRIIHSPSTVHDDVVFKEIMSLPQVANLDRHRYTTDLEVQTVASKLALEFNDRLARTTRDPNLKLKFLMAKVVRFENGKSHRFMAFEKRFHGPTTEMVKYTNNLDLILNSGSLNEASKTCLYLALAFSHFTHSVTDGYLLVCDLQGITTKDKKGKPTLLLTDPAIHCPKHLRFGRTNLGSLGVSKFFDKHECNSFCLALGLTIPSKFD